MKILFPSISSFLLLLYGCGHSPETGHKQPVKVSIPFFFGFNNDHFPSSSTSIIVYAPGNHIVFENKGYNPSLGFHSKGKLTLTGQYRVHVRFYPDSGTKKEFETSFDIDGDEKQIELVVNLRKGFQEGNEIYINKHFGNKYHVHLSRLWDPQKQFASKRALLPDYEWSNSYDSTIYGIYRQFSSSSTVSWVRDWNIAYMKFQQYKDSDWTTLECNAPRIEAVLKKGQTGKTLNDMVLSCDNKVFVAKGRYRV